MVGGYVTVNSIAGDFFQPNNGIVASLKSWLSFATMDNEAVAQILSSKLSPPKYDFTPCFTFAQKKTFPAPISNLTSEEGPWVSLASSVVTNNSKADSHMR